MEGGDYVGIGMATAPNREVGFVFDREEKEHAKGGNNYE
jgi:hypothetical protein